MKAITSKLLVVAVVALACALLAGCFGALKPKPEIKIRNHTVKVRPYIPPVSKRTRDCLNKPLPPVEAGDVAKWNRTARARNACGKAVLKQYDLARSKHGRKRRANRSKRKRR